MIALPRCSSCGRHELPPPSDVPPSGTMAEVLVELLRFAHEFDEQDPAQHYGALEFVDWIALAVGQTLDHSETREAGAISRHSRDAA